MLDVRQPDDIFYIMSVKWPGKVNGQILGTQGMAIRLCQVAEAYKKSRHNYSILGLI